MGLLQVKGTLELDQFWPKGTSDADTAKVFVTVGKNAFKFRPHPGAAFTVTHALENAKVKGSVTKSPIDAQGRITVRLQGIDAPELHYRPSPLPHLSSVTSAMRLAFKSVDKQYRQYFGETASAALLALLSKSGASKLGCIVETQVEHPNDVFDTYGRFVGDILVDLGKKSLNLNRWIVEHGYAFPTFYTSMSASEINEYLIAMKAGKKSGRVWNLFQKTIPAFDPHLVLRKNGPPKPAADKVPLIMPKLFRRQCTWWTYRKTGTVKGIFRDFLKQKPDALILTNDFLLHGVYSAPHHQLSEFISAKNRFALEPQDMVFTEKTSVLIDPNGKPIQSW